MDNKAVLKLLQQAIPDELIFADEPMKNHTSFKIGGNADFLVTPNGVGQLCALIKALHGVPYFVMGNGSNLLVHDEGYRGVVIQLGNGLSDIRVEGDRIIAQSGALLSKIANVALDAGLTGFEFASGIPGSLGGAVLMNAGAYGGEMQQVVVKSQYIDEEGRLRELTDHDFGYRHSVFSQHNWIIVSSTIQLQPGYPSEIKAYMMELNQRRKDKQPLEMPSAGSTFKRPEGYFAGKLIEDAGMKGYTVGGAQVSEKHSGFVINKNNATYSDVITLIDDVRQAVYGQFGVELEMEVKIL